MNKFFVLVAILTLLFAGCDDGNNTKTTLQINNQSSKSIRNIIWNNIAFKDAIDNDSIFFGSWNFTSANGQIYLSVYSNNTYYLYYSLTEIYFTTGTWTRNENTLTLYSDSMVDTTVFLVSEDRLFLDYYIRIRSGLAVNGTATLSRVGESLSPGASIKKIVDPGYSYIFFTYNSTAYRTRDLITVEKNEWKTFVFTDYTLVVEVTNPDETKTLGGL